MVIKYRVMLLSEGDNKVERGAGIILRVTLTHNGIVNKLAYTGQLTEWFGNTNRSLIGPIPELQHVVTGKA